MQTHTFEFKDFPIHFNMLTEKNLMVNATEMARIYRKEPHEFLRLDSTKAFVSALVESANNGFADVFKPGKSRSENRPDSTKPALSGGSNSGISPELEPENIVFSEDDFVQTMTGRHGSGTWMHRHLAIKFAAWLDVRFELWMIESIDQILLPHTGTIDRRRRTLTQKSELDTERDFWEAELKKSEPYLKLLENRSKRKSVGHTLDELDHSLLAGQLSLF